MEWLFLGIINLIFAVINLVIQLIQKRVKYGIITSVIILLCPIVSVVLFGAVWVLEKLFLRRGAQRLNMEELSFKKERVKLTVSADVKSEMQKIPVEEALIVSDKFSKRETILNILKNDYSDFLSSIRTAVEDKDSEIAHYAATTITQAIEQFKTNEIQLRAICQESETLEDLGLYIDYVEDFLEKGLLPEFEIKKYMESLIEKIWEVKEKYREAFDIERCNHLIMLLIEYQNYETAEEWLDFLLKNCEEELATYKNGLKLYQRTDRREEFLELMKTMKDSSVILDAEALEWVRFYQV